MSSNDSGFFELVESSSNSVSTFTEAEQILKDCDSTLESARATLSSFSLHVAFKDKPLDCVVTESNIQDIYKLVEGATAVKIKSLSPTQLLISSLTLSLFLREGWASDDCEPLCLQLSSALQNNQTATSVELDFAYVKHTLHDTCIA